MKGSRHQKIIELIESYKIGTQEELAERLREAGFKVTQATVSRDIRQLKLTFSSGDYDRVLYAKTENIWGKVNNNIWNSECMPFFTTMENIINMVEVGKKVSDLTEEELNAISPEERHYTLYKDHQPAEMPGTLLYTSEELEKLADIQAAIDSYAKEQIMAFIVGNQSLDGWDAFQAELRKMGLEDYVSIMQAAYDRKTA